MYASRPLPETRLPHIERFLRVWLEKSTETEVHGEILEYGRFQMQRYQSPPNPKSYGRDGFEVSFESYKSVTWPWLELYLIIRRTFPKRERLSFEFANKMPQTEKAADEMDAPI